MFLPWYCHSKKVAIPWYLRLSIGPFFETTFDLRTYPYYVTTKHGFNCFIILHKQGNTIAPLLQVICWSICAKLAQPHAYIDTTLAKLCNLSRKSFNLKSIIKCHSISSLACLPYVMYVKYLFSAYSPPSNSHINQD